MRNSKYTSILLNQFLKRYPIEPFNYEVFPFPDLRGENCSKEEYEFNVDEQLNYRFVSPQIRGYVGSHSQIKSKIDDNIYVSLTRGKVPEIDYSKVCIIKNFVNDIFGTNINPDIYLILQPMKKKITTLNHYTSHNINSGMTDQSKIVVFRYEEWEKVLIHELLHCVYGHQTFNIRPNLGDMYKINGKIKTNEAFIESQALIIYCMYVKKMYNKDIFMDEIQFSLYQCSKIGRQFKQETSVFSYFIIKTALLLNTNYYDFLRKGNKTKREFKQLVNESIRNPTFINIITEQDMKYSIDDPSVINYLDNNYEEDINIDVRSRKNIFAEEYANTTNKFLYESLRMTMHTFL